ncbi:hypothetical protein ACK3SF_02755 [Candidatus Nanosalina sp. VS9-1]|uniref:hypothetical protein n=1 Tax=Candidatus Nanosalina sp. VS9-1 TaxID=3388566 RepID=UPI0039DF389F
MEILENIHFTGLYTASSEDVEQARERKASHVYENFVAPVLEDLDGREIFQVHEVKDDIRPPYSYREIRDALEYGSRESDELEFIEEDMDLFLYRE